MTIEQHFAIWWHFLDSDFFARLHAFAFCFFATASLRRDPRFIRDSRPLPFDVERGDEVVEGELVVVVTAAAVDMVFVAEAAVVEPKWDFLSLPPFSLLLFLWLWTAFLNLRSFFPSLSLIISATVGSFSLVARHFFSCKLIFTERKTFFKNFLAS